MFNHVTEFEERLANFFGAPYAVAVDSCTHALELSLRYTNTEDTFCPRYTYASVPMTLHKLDIKWHYEEIEWEEFYYLGGTQIIDAATMWRPNSYRKGTYTCISFQFQKHLSLGRGGAILVSNFKDYDALTRMSYDGRARGTPWAKQEINAVGYHYYMTPETAQLGLEKFDAAVAQAPRIWTWKDYPDLRKNLQCF